MYNFIKNKYLFILIAIIFFCLFVSNNLFLLYKFPLIFISFFMNIVGIKFLLILDFFILIYYIFYKENFILKNKKKKIVKRYIDLIITLIVLLLSYYFYNKINFYFLFTILALISLSNLYKIVLLYKNDNLKIYNTSVYIYALILSLSLSITILQNKLNISLSPSYSLLFVFLFFIFYFSICFQSFLGIFIILSNKIKSIKNINNKGN